MFFANAKDQAKETLSREEKEYKDRYQEVLSHTEQLLDTRYAAAQLLHECEKYIQTVSGCPYEYDLKKGEINKNYQKFEKQLKKYNYKPHKSNAGFLLGTGAAAGAGVAVLGPNAAMAAAMTFGTASTGTAISALSGGAAATNAALAWLGGGTLAAGGAGMAGGQALLALAGPVGITIGAGCAVAAGVKFALDNKKKAQRAEVDTAALKKEITRLRAVEKRVDVLRKETISLSQLVAKELEELKALKKQEYRSFSGREAKQLETLMNNAQSLAARIVEVVPLDG